MAVILGGLKERDPKFNIKNNGSCMTQDEMARSATEFVNSDDFIWWCKMIDASPKRMRAMSPERAARLYEDLITIVRKRGKNE